MKEENKKLIRRRERCQCCWTFSLPLRMEAKNFITSLEFSIVWTKNWQKIHLIKKGS